MLEADWADKLSTYASKSNSTMVPSEQSSWFLHTTVDIQKWSVFYDGKVSLFDFLEQVEMLRIFRGFSKEQIT